MQNYTATAGIAKPMSKAYWLAGEGILPNDAERSVERNEAVLKGELGSTVRITLDVSEVTDMTFFVARGAMVLVERIEVRAGGETSVGQIPRDTTEIATIRYSSILLELGWDVLDMEPMFLPGIQVLDIPSNLYGVSESLLFECYGPFDR